MPTRPGLLPVLVLKMVLVMALVVLEGSMSRGALVHAALMFGESARLVGTLSESWKACARQVRCC